MNHPLLSVVIINWNAARYINGCLQSVLNNSYPNKEIILIDNHSDDQSLEALKEGLPSYALENIRIVVNDKNYGAAYALNQGALMAKGEYVSFLASDTKLDPGCLSEIVRAFESDKDIGAISAKLLMMDNPKRIDSAGEYLNQFGLLTQRHAGLEIDNGQFDKQADIFSAKGTALSVRKDIFLKAGLYPQEYFMFLEETDLCWRIWLSGSRVVFIPDAVIYHASGASINASPRKKYLVKYYGARNYITTLFANLGTVNLFLILPLNLLLWLLLAIGLACTFRIAEGWYVAKGILWNITNIRPLLKKRRFAQQLRKINDSGLMPQIMKKVTLAYLLDRVRTW